MKIRLLIISFCLYSFAIIAGGLKGNYTIDPKGSGSTNYLSFASAAKALTDSGISGAVVFSAADGKYIEHVKWDSVTGASHTNTITIRSASGDSSKVIIQYSSTADSDNFIFDLVGKYYIIKGMSFINKGKSYSTSIFLEQYSSNNSILNCNIRGAKNATSRNQSLVVGGGDEIDSLVISNNRLKYGYESLVTTPDGGPYWGFWNVYSNNIIDTPTNLAFMMYNQNYDVVTGNTVNCSDSFVEGMYYFEGENSLVQGNKFINARITTEYGYFYYFINNFMVNSYNAISCFGGEPYIYNNSILITKPSFRYSLGIELTGDAGEAAGGTVYNNIIVDTFKNGYAILSASQSSHGSSFLYSDYNDILLDTNFSGHYMDSFHVAGHDKHSLSVNPRYVGKYDLHVRNDSIHHKGTPLSNVTVDIDNEPRSAKPDIGADEFRAHDLSPFAIISPVNMQCGDSNTIVKASVRNLGIDTEFNAKVYLNINGKIKDSVIISGAFLPVSTDTVFFKNTLNTFSNPKYNFRIYTALPKDEKTSNDTLQDSVHINIPDAAFIKTHGYCEDDTFKFAAKDTSNTGYTWVFGDSITYKSSKIISRKIGNYNGYMGLWLTVKNASGCKKTSYDSFLIGICAGIKSVKEYNSAEIYPNPFHHSTEIKYSIENTENVQIEVYSISGEKVATLIDKNQSAGEYTISFNPSNYGITNAGIYLLKIKTGDRFDYKKIILLK